MSFPSKLLAPGEEVYLDSRPNWSYLFWPSVFTLLVLAGCVAVVVLWGSAPAYTGLVLLACALCVLVYFAGRYVGWRTTTFVVTSQRIVYRTGVVRRTGREIPIGRVQDVTYHQTVVERVVRAGSLTVESAGRHGQDPFPDISRPAEVQSLINRVVAQGPAGYPVGPLLPPPTFTAPAGEVSQPTTDPTPRAPAPPAAAFEDAPSAPSAVAAPPAPAGPSVAQQMSELAELHRHGVITDAEYELKRREMLDRL
ncbi:MAG: PH domain-containing protein [Acidimicrobiales bacterium]